MDERTLLWRSAVGLSQLAVVMALMLFIPAGTIHFWQAWAFLAVFVGASAIVTAHLFRHDRGLLERRLRAGPGAEARPMQKLIQGLASLAFLATLVVPALDHRWGWSHLPTSLPLLGDAMVALGFWCVFRVFVSNSYTAATIEVAESQPLVTTGPYAVVRHPMYAGALVLVVGTPLALGSAWGLLASAGLTVALVARILDEERLLERELPGYDDYRHATRYRLIPFVW